MEIIKSYILRNKKSLIFATLFLIGALVSFFVLTEITTSKEMFKGIIEVLNQKSKNVLGLTATTAATSTAITLIPDDVGLPIANEIANFSSWLLIITCAIQLEKFLVISMGYVSFGILVPISCFSGIVYQFNKNELFKKFALKFFVFAIVLFLLIPASVGVTQIIDKSVEELNGLYEPIQEEIIEETEDKGFWDKLVSKAEDTVEKALKKAENTLNKLVNEIAALVVTSIVIPVLVFLLFVWLINAFIGTNIKVSRLPKRTFYKKKGSLTDGKK